MKEETITISRCCLFPAFYGRLDNPDGYFRDGWYCNNCKRECRTLEKSLTNSQE